ncbi:MAG: hypothetical protein Q7K26_04735 [bacterium]|nr:hypothetical protein [bacterium]
MTPVVIFSISGLAMILLVTTKKLGEGRKKCFFILNIISRGDIHIRRFYHHIIYYYSVGKEQILFLIKKQIPIHSKNAFNKLLTFLKEKKGQYIVSMRDSRLLRKQDGISEFFKNISEIKKENGEIHDVCENASPNDCSVELGSQDDKKE